MELTKNLRNRHWLIRIVLPAGLAVVALRSLRQGKPVRGVLAGLGVVALGYSAVTESNDVMEHLTVDLDTEAASETTQLRCAICGDPIVPGQSRRPNEDNETVHEACLKASA
ncbi:hypothetical protein HAPAU_41700 [Halalkalicoccus paucihalophilus]|uniref:Uncharacterized protein n=1 Tax=Halalkalicoccus paucihalophilus TaxID=1008153 RepID=A0A151A8U4_9EURY|nr:hypothetical protein [Halalkalicoccus paucihalophilus]KYH24091.1 hypothetical protein HAPAU_41700 [Halalkalicoccus paucihalophilus]